MITTSENIMSITDPDGRPIATLDICEALTVGIHTGNKIIRHEFLDGLRSGMAAYQLHERNRVIRLLNIGLHWDEILRVLQPKLEWSPKGRDEWSCGGYRIVELGEGNFRVSGHGKVVDGNHYESLQEALDACELDNMILECGPAWYYPSRSIERGLQSCKFEGLKDGEKRTPAS